MEATFTHFNQRNWATPPAFLINRQPTQLICLLLFLIIPGSKSLHVFRLQFTARQNKRIESSRVVSPLSSYDTLGERNGKVKS